MDLTIEQALQQGVLAHKEGKLEDAERLYRVILQSQPTHPDANHNLGVLAVAVNKFEAALPLFKTALTANPRIEQFWLSYIDALIKGDQFDNAKQIIEEGKKQGLTGVKLNTLELQLASGSQTQTINFENPSQQELNSLLEYYQTGRYGDAEKLAQSLTERFPEHQFGWKVLGAVLKQTGRVSESLVASQKSVQLAPQDAEAHYNLGNMLHKLGRLEEVEISYRQALVFNPDYAEAHNNLGIILKELGKLTEAEACYRHALAIKPDYVQALSNLGNILQELGRLEEALANYNKAILYNKHFRPAITGLGKLFFKKGMHKEGLNMMRIGDGSIYFDINNGFSIK